MNKVQSIERKTLIKIPEFCLVALIGPSGSGKSTFARRNFKQTEILSSDFFRGMICDEEHNQDASKEAFEALYAILKKRLKRLKITVVDATNVKRESRQILLDMAKKYHCTLIAVVLNMPEKLCIDRNIMRLSRCVPAEIVSQHVEDLHISLPGLKSEGFKHIYVLSSPEEANSVIIEKEPLWNNLRYEHGPFDIIGDVHGCHTELEMLLKKLGYKTKITNNGANHYEISHPEGRKVIFLGDLVDRGPNTPEVLRLVMSMVKSGSAFCIAGNHDIKLAKKLKGKDIKISHGLAESLEQLQKEKPEFIKEVVNFIDSLVTHYVLDNGKLVVAHGGLKEKYQGRISKRVIDFALYGETTGETDEYGLPVRKNWTLEYEGKAMVVYGHTPAHESEWLNKTINIDNGCVFGGKLTALRYPEKEIVSVNALKTYFEPAGKLK